MVDAVYLVLLEKRAEQLVYLARRSRIDAERLLDDDVRPAFSRRAWLREAGMREAFEDRFVVLGCD